MLIPHSIKNLVFQFNYTLYNINNKISILLIKYSKWEDNASWCVGSLEVNPFYNNLEILKNKKRIILEQYNLLKIYFPELPLLQSEFKFSFLLKSLSNKIYSIDIIDHIDYIINIIRCRENLIQIV
jgi:hypothetical protein